MTFETGPAGEAGPASVDLFPKAERSIRVRLSTAAVVVFAAVLPVAMVLANRSSPAVLVIAVLLGALALNSAAQQSLLAGLGKPWRRLLPAITAGFLLWILISIAWAPNLNSSLRQAAEAAVPLVGVLVAFSVLQASRYSDHAYLWAMVSIAAAILIIADLQAGLMLRRLLQAREQSFVYNRSVVSLLFTSWPILALLWIDSRRALAFTLVFAVLAAILVSDSQSALFAVGVGGLAAALARLRWNAANGLATVAVVLIVLSAPLLGMLSDALPTQTPNVLNAAHATERLAIWRAFAEVVALSPFWGQGFGASAMLPDATVTEVLTQATREAMRQVHPHNAFLQVWVELGLVGAALLASLIIAFLRKIGRMPHQLRPFAFGYMASVLAVAAVSHGAWQAWWIASAGAGAIGFALASRARSADLATQTGAPNGSV